MALSIRRAALASASLAFFAALAPAACSSKAPVTEPVIGGCASDSACQSQNGHCDNGRCHPNCNPVSNDCAAGESCGSDGRCTSAGSGGTSSGGTGSGGTGVIPVPEAGPDADGSLEPDAACGTGSASATLVPVSMFVMFDRSGSMIQNGSTRWADASSALTQFFQDPGAAELAVALRFFPHDQPAPGCTNSASMGCIAADCAQPLVPLMADPTMPLPKLTADPAPLDTHEEALVTAIMNSPPVDGGNGGTPTSVALQGALDWAAAYQAAHPLPEQQTVVIFVTDGEPRGCEEDIDNISQIAADALAASGVRTYVVGLASAMAGLPFLNQLAMAGGTDAAFEVTDGAQATADLIAALKAIQGSELECNFPYPEAEDGGMSDPSRINVDYTPSAPGSMPVRFYRVENAAACMADQPGWYYDDPAAPTQIYLCESACTMATADAKPKIKIEIGCTSTPPPEH